MKKTVANRECEIHINKKKKKKKKKTKHQIAKKGTKTFFCTFSPFFLDNFTVHIAHHHQHHYENIIIIIITRTTHIIISLSSLL